MDLAQAIEDEKKRLHAMLEKLELQKLELEEEVHRVRSELNAISAYENAKRGDVNTSDQQSRRRGSIRAQVMDAISASPQGINRSTLLVMFGAKGDKVKTQSITNAVSNLRRAGEVLINHGMYTINTMPVNGTD